MIFLDGIDQLFLHIGPSALDVPHLDWTLSRGLMIKFHFTLERLQSAFDEK